MSQPNYRRQSIRTLLAHAWRRYKTRTGCLSPLISTGFERRRHPDVKLILSVLLFCRIPLMHRSVAWCMSCGSDHSVSIVCPVSPGNRKKPVCLGMIATRRTIPKIICRSFVFPCKSHLEFWFHLGPAIKCILCSKRNVKWCFNSHHTPPLLGVAEFYGRTGPDYRGANGMWKVKGTDAIRLLPYLLASSLVSSGTLADRRSKANRGRPVLRKNE